MAGRDPSRIAPARVPNKVRLLAGAGRHRLEWPLARPVSTCEGRSGLPGVMGRPDTPKPCITSLPVTWSIADEGLQKETARTRDTKATGGQ